VDVVAELPADTMPAEPVQQRDGGFGYPTVSAQPRAVLGASEGDDRSDADLADLAAVRLTRINGESLSKIARELEVSSERLRFWRKQADIDDRLLHHATFPNHRGASYRMRHHPSTKTGGDAIIR